jgi:hypothetical protein
VLAVQSVGKTVGNKTLRRVWRIVANTGELRGVCWRERDAKRKAVKYVGKRNRSQEFKAYNDAYEGWRRANRTLVGAGIVTPSDVIGTGRGTNSVG